MTGGAFGWRDTLDILLVALVIYRIFTLFLGTRAMQMLVGVGVLVAASLAATAAAVLGGAALIRAHGVAETVDAVRVAERVRRAAP